MQSEETYIQKCLELTNEHSAQTARITVKIPYIPATREINIVRALHTVQSSGLQLLHSHVFYLNSHKQIYIHIGVYPLSNDIFLPLELFPENYIKIKYRRLHHENASVPHNDIVQRKKKVKERCIKQAIEYVRKWRNFYEMVDCNGKRVHTLESAARQVGVAKKTLDDYFYQFKQGQRYGFDFQAHNNDKIGVLRAFLRNCYHNSCPIKTQIPQMNYYSFSKQSEQINEVDETDKYWVSSSPSGSDSQQDKKEKKDKKQTKD